MSIEPWNTAAGGRAACEDMPRKSIDKRLTDNPVQQKRGRLRPFPAIRRGRVRAEPANGSRDESLVGFGATPQGLKTTNICNFRGSFEPILLAQFFHRLFDTTVSPMSTPSSPQIPARFPHLCAFSSPNPQRHARSLPLSPTFRKKRSRSPPRSPCGTHSHSPASLSSRRQSRRPWNPRRPPR